MKMWSCRQQLLILAENWSLVHSALFLHQFCWLSEARMCVCVCVCINTLILFQNGCIDAKKAAGLGWWWRINWVELWTATQDSLDMIPVNINWPWDAGVDGRKLYICWKDSVEFVSWAVYLGWVVLFQNCELDFLVQNAPGPRAVCVWHSREIPLI